MHLEGARNFRKKYKWFNKITLKEAHKPSQLLHINLWYLHSSFHLHTRNIQADTHRRMILVCSHTCTDKGSLRNCTHPDLRMGSDKDRHISLYQCTQSHIKIQATNILNLSKTFNWDLPVLSPLSFSIQSISSPPLITIAGGPISGELEALVTGTHEWAVCVQTAVRAWVCRTLVHIWWEWKRTKVADVKIFSNLLSLTIMITLIWYSCVYVHLGMSCYLH